MKNSAGFWALILAAGALLLGCARHDQTATQSVSDSTVAHASSAPLKKFQILLDWQAEPTYLGVYYAKSLGLYERLGLDVEIIPSWGANQAVGAVAAGKYQVATASGGATVLGYNSGSDIVSLAVLYPRIPTVVYGLAKSGISKPSDLVGRRVGIYPGSISKNEFDVFLKANHILASKLDVVSLSGPDIPLLLAGKLDAVLHYTEMSPVAVELRPDVAPIDGHKTFELHLADQGVGGYGLNIITSRTSWNADSTLLRQVAAAMVEGYREGRANPQAAVAAFLEVFPDKDPAYVRESWRRVCELVGPVPGRQDLKGWQETVGIYRNLGLLNVNVDPARLLP